ncbi:sister chromatid cohesion protein DCC1-like [Watersipora subatra]|uniref:sister chromatid cohesion protein DCC1-like n=1 Tax=Watersipora subatra TaxID=2589382 RepID=UPI00355BFE07
MEDNESEAQSVTEASLVAKILQFAKLNLSSVNNDVQQLFFSRSLQNNDVKLLELNPTIEKQISENGGKLHLKGNATDNCVLCTAEHTFEVKDTEISNSLLLVPGVVLDLDKNNSVKDDKMLSLRGTHVESICGSYLEPRLIQPKVNVLLGILESSVYDGPEKENVDSVKLTLTDILSNTLASDGEIEKVLFNLHAIELDGYIRLIHFDYLSRVIGSIADLIDENCWCFKSFDHGMAISILSELYPRAVIKHVLESHGSAVAATEDGSTDSWCLDEDKVCRYYAEMLLKPTQKFNLTEFLDAWKDSVPEGMITSLSQLDGMAFADRTSEPAVMRYFPVEQLSEDVKKRFEELFGVKKSWTLQEITPYVKPLCVGKVTVSVLVMKNARSFNKAGTKYFTSKYIRN